MKTVERETSVIRATHDGRELGVCALAAPDEVRAALDANVAAGRTSIRPCCSTRRRR